MNYKLLLLFLSLIVAGCSNTDEPISQDTTAEVAVDSVQTNKVAEFDSYGFRVDTLTVKDYEVSRNESLYLILDKFDFNPQEIYSVTQQAEHIIDLRSFKPGQQYRVYASAEDEEQVSRLVWQPTPLEYVVFDWQQDSLDIYKSEKEMTTIRRSASGLVQRSLYETMMEEGLSPMLAYKMSDIYAWQIDFFRLRSGDAFKVIYEEHYVDDSFYSIGDILAVEFVHRGEPYSAYYFEDENMDGFYDEEGNSVQKALLKAPFRYSQRISSGFSHSRFHPVLKRNRPHYGVDYAAPHGTPILSVGDGTVTEAQYRGANGNIVKIRHNGTYETAYLHLNGFASGIRSGATVKQGQVIGYVGRTGRVTGTHLDYRVYKDGRPVNPLTLDLPAAESIPDSLMDSFAETREGWDNLLNKLVDPGVLVSQ